MWSDRYKEIVLTLNHKTFPYLLLTRIGQRSLGERQGN